MNTTIEEIRKRITAAIDYRDEAGDYDEYGSGQSVGLATALQIIDEVEKEHPIPEDVQEAANQYIGYPPEVDEGVSTSLRRKAFADGMLGERSRLASCPTFKCWAARDKPGTLFIYKNKPRRVDDCIWNAIPDIGFFEHLFPDLRWEDEPIEVELLIIRK